MTNDNDDLSNIQKEEDIVDVAESTGMEEAAPSEDGAQKEIAELKDKYLRTVAEMQNMQRRNQIDLENANKYAVSNAAKPLLGVADNLKRALEMAPADLPDNVKSLLEGIRATERSLQQALERMGVTAIDAAAGIALNPHEHEVMFEVDTSDHEHGTVVQVLEVGYKIHDRLLRPARVSVAKNMNGLSKNVDVCA